MKLAGKEKSRFESFVGSMILESLKVVEYHRP